MTYEIWMIEGVLEPLMILFTIMNAASIIKFIKELIPVLG